MNTELEQLMVFVYDSEDEQLAEGFYDKMIELGDEIVLPLVKIMGSTDDEAPVEMAATALEKMGNRILNELLKIVTSNEDASCRINALHILAKIEDERVVSTLLKIVDNPDEHTTSRWLAASHLGRIGRTEFIAPLLKVLNRKENTRLEAVIVDSLGRIGDASVVSTLVSELQSSDNQVRMRAVNALGQIGKSEVASALFPLLSDPDEMVSITALGVLSELGDKNVLHELQEHEGQLRSLREFYDRAIDRLKARFDLN